jgi:hypothetical protein
MTLLVLDSGGLARLSRHRQDAAALIAVLGRDGLWPPLVPSVVLVEALSGRRRLDAEVDRLLKTRDIVGELSESLARRAVALRALAGRGSAVDAVVVAMAEPGGAVLGGDLDDLRGLASHGDDVTLHRA